VESFNLKDLNKGEGKEQYLVKIPNRVCSFVKSE
jgi:hypothetical protein